MSLGGVGVALDDDAVAGGLDGGRKGRDYLQSGGLQDSAVSGEDDIVDQDVDDKAAFFAAQGDAPGQSSLVNCLLQSLLGFVEGRLVCRDSSDGRLRGHGLLLVLAHRLALHHGVDLVDQRRHDVRGDHGHCVRFGGILQGHGVTGGR